MGKSEIPVTDETVTRSQLREEIDRLIEQLETGQPAYTPPPFSLAGLLDLLEQTLRYFAPQMQLDMLHRFRQQVADGTFDMDTLQGAWYLAQYTLQMQADIVKRHVAGDYETDEWGLDWELLELVRPLLDFLYAYYFRVQTNGLDHIPDYGRALLVANHTGPLPWDTAMLTTAVLNEHPSQRLVRGMYATWLPTLPFISPLLERMGQVLANPDNARRLLQQEELVAVFPEGNASIGNMVTERHRLTRFGRGNFIKTALTNETPIIPVAIVNANEWSPLGTSLLSPPVSLRLPWLGLLGLIPLPSRWAIDFGPPLDFNHYGQGGAENVLLVSRLSDQVRDTIQTMIDKRREGDGGK
jgi:1-acyl-sn-glycerol-3-phosphate acyltransferase